MSGQPAVVVLGAGPAGLGAAVRLARRRRFAVTVLERGRSVGGNAGSFELEDQRVDYGSHRLHPACAPEILADIQRMLGEDLLSRPRHGRIRLRGRWIHFPLKPIDLALRLPPSFLAGVALDAARRRNGHHGDDTFASVLERHLGRTICQDFYFPYARKIWGVSPGELEAEQARRRVSASSIRKMVRKALGSIPGLRPPGAGRFYYPRRGYGQISEGYFDAARGLGVDVRLESGVSSIELDEQGTTVTFANGTRDAHRVSAAHVLSTIPLPALARLMRPRAPAEVLASADALKYRAMVLVYLVLEADRFTEYDAHYFPETDIAITRLSEPKNYGLSGPDGRTVLCAELPCSLEDETWRASDERLGEVVRNALAGADLPVRPRVRRVVTRRLPQAYPIYTTNYREHFDRLDAWVGSLERVLTFGRQGLFAHDNTHHALAMAYAAGDCLDDDARLDRQRWSEHRHSFTAHVVED